MSMVVLAKWFHYLFYTITLQICNWNRSMFPLVRKTQILLWILKSLKWTQLWFSPKYSALSLITYSVSLIRKHSVCCIHHNQSKLFWAEVVILAPRRLRQKDPCKSKASMGFKTSFGHNTVSHNPLQVETKGPGSLLISIQPHGTHVTS